MSVVTPPETDVVDRPEKRSKKTLVLITFSEANLKGMSQPYDDTLIMTSRIDRFLVKKVMINQGSAVEIMYSNLFIRN